MKSYILHIIKNLSKEKLSLLYDNMTIENGNNDNTADGDKDNDNNTRVPTLNYVIRSACDSESVAGTSCDDGNNRKFRRRRMGCGRLHEGECLHEDKTATIERNEQWRMDNRKRRRIQIVDNWSESIRSEDENRRDGGGRRDDCAYNANDTEREIEQNVNEQLNDWSASGDVTAYEFDTQEEQITEEIDLGKIFYYVESWNDKIFNGKQTLTLGSVMALTLDNTLQLNNSELKFIHNMLIMDVANFIINYIDIFQNISSNYSMKFNKLINLCAQTSSNLNVTRTTTDCGGIEVKFNAGSANWTTNFRRLDNLIQKNTGARLYLLRPNVISACYNRARRVDFQNFSVHEYTRNSETSTTERYYKTDLARKYFYLTYGKLAILENNLFPAKISNY